MGTIINTPRRNTILLAVIAAIALAVFAVLTVSAQEPRGVISGVNIDADTPGQATISWNAVTDAKDYRVTFAKSGEEYKTWNASSGNRFPTTNSVTLTNLTEGETYKFKIRSRFEEEQNGSLSGPWSAEHTFTVAVSLPAAPTGLTVSASAHYSITLSWDDPGDDSITGYMVLRRNVETQDPGVFTTIKSNTGSAATSYTDTTVSAETSYVYRVKAINPAGTSPQSNYVDVDTPAAPPAAPTGLSATTVSHDSVTLGWDDPGDDSITGYVVQRHDVDTQDPGVFATIESNTGSPATSYTDTTVSAETGYVYRVQAINPAGTSPQSNHVDVTTEAEPPNPGSKPPADQGNTPRQATSTDATLSALTVDGTSVAGFDSETTSYQYGVASTVTQVTVATTTTNSSATVSFSPADAETGTAGHQVDLSAGSNSVTITVTAEDTTTTEEYTLSVNRGVTTTFGWKASDDFDTLIAAGNNRPAGIWSDGTTMWVVDTRDKKLYAYNLSTKTHDSSKDFDTLDAAGNDNATGIWSDGTTMWVVDSTNDKIYAYNLSTKARDSSKDFDTRRAASNIKPTGIWSDRTTMWVADNEDGKLYAYNVSTKARDSSKDFDTLDAAGNAAPYGIWSNGTTMWVTHTTDDKIYAYNLSTKARDSDKDFETLDAAGNEDPGGLWSNGTTMWVIDGLVYKIYSYNAPSDDATLSAVRVDGRAIPGFDADRTSYQYGVGHAVTQVTVAATTGHASATVAFSPTDAPTTTTTGHQVDLSAGSNAVTITVTAEDTTTTKEYTLSVNRGVTNDFGWKASDDFDTLTAAGNDDPVGTWSDGDTMWVVDNDGVKIYAYNLSTKARDSSKDFDTLDAAGNDNPKGSWSDGTTMWVADSTEDKIYAYNLSTKARDSSKDFNTLDAADNNFPLGLWSDGTTMWVADTTDNKIYAYNLSTKARDSSQDFDTLDDAGNDDATGIWSDGTTMWAADGVDDNIYAYNLSSKARDSSKDFDTLDDAGNENPYGIWSDGTTMWVADATDDKIYSYNMPLSDDATLSAVRVDGTTIPGFDADQTSYQYGVSHTVTQVTVAATTGHASATVAFSPADAATTTTPGHQVDLSAGSNAVTITVTAENTTTTKEYTLSVNRGVTTNYGWKAADDFDTLIAAGNTIPYGIWSDRTTMWAADNDDDKLYAYNLSTKARDSSKDFNTLAAADNDNPTGIWSDGTTMWVADFTDDKLYAYNLSTEARVSSEDFNTLSAAQNTASRGIWSDGTTMWVTDGVDKKLYAYNLSTKARDSSKDFDTLDAADNDGPVGIWSDGTTMWVADTTDDKLYAYNLSTKARDSSKDFDTLIDAGNADPVGIWSDGTTMWVVQGRTTDKIYSYNMDLPAPSNLDAMHGSRRVTLLWDGPMSTDISDFQYRVSADSGTSWSPDWRDIPGSGANTRTYTVTSLTNGTEYTFQVRAVYMRAGQRLAGQESTVRATPQIPPPAQPSGFRATHGDTEVSLRWNNPGDNTITHYQHRVSADGRASWTPDWTDIPDSSRSTTRLTVESLTNDTEYTFEVRAVNAGGESPAATGTATPRDLSPPVLVSTTVNGTELELTYDEPLDENSLPNQDQYTLSVSPRPATTVAVSNVSISAAVVTLTLAPAVEDIHTVRLTYRAPSTNAIADPTGNKAPGFSNRLVTNNSPLPQVPDAPTSLRATPKGPNRIDLTWTAPANEGGAVVSGYKIEVSTDNSSWTDLVANTSSTDTTHSHTGLELGNRRHYRVSAINRGGTSQPSSVANATTDNRPYLTMTARRIRTDSVPTEVGTLRVPVYEVMIEASQPVKGIGNRWAYEAVQSYITNGTLFSWGAVATSRSGIPAHHTKWRLEVIPHLPETRGPNTVTIAVPEGVVKDDLTSHLPNRLNRAQTPFRLVVDNLPSSDVKRPRARITYEQGSPVSIVHDGPFRATVTFNEPVTGFERNELRVSGATVESFTSNQSGSSYVATIKPNAPRGEETVSISISVANGVARDRAGHTNIGDSVGLLARPRPTVEIVIPKANPNPSTMNENDPAYLPESGWFFKSQSSAFGVVVKFSKPMTGFLQEELVVEGYQQADRTCLRAGGASITGWSSRRSGRERVATITPSTTGIIAISVAAGAAQDSDGYLNLGDGRHFVYMSMPGSDDEQCQITDAP